MPFTVMDVGSMVLPYLRYIARDGLSLRSKNHKIILFISQYFKK